MTRNCSFEGLLCKAGYGTVHKLLGTKMKHLFLAFRGQLDSQQMALVLQKCGPSTKRFGFFFRLQIRVLRLLQTLILVRLLGLLDFCLLPELETTAVAYKVSFATVYRQYPRIPWLALYDKAPFDAKIRRRGVDRGSFGWLWVSIPLLSCCWFLVVLSRLPLFATQFCMAHKKG